MSDGGNCDPACLEYFFWGVLCGSDYYLLLGGFVLMSNLSPPEFPQISLYLLVVGRLITDD